jgi:hypothetical protein
MGHCRITKFSQGEPAGEDYLEHGPPDDRRLHFYGFRQCACREGAHLGRALALWGDHKEDSQR